MKIIIGRILTFIYLTTLEQSNCYLHSQSIDSKSSIKSRYSLEELKSSLQTSDVIGGVKPLLLHVQSLHLLQELIEAINETIEIVIKIFFII